MDLNSSIIFLNHPKFIIQKGLEAGNGMNSTAQIENKIVGPRAIIYSLMSHLFGFWFLISPKTITVWQLCKAAMRCID